MLEQVGGEKSFVAVMVKGSKQSKSSPRAFLERSLSVLRAFLAFLEQHILSHTVGAQNTSSCSKEKLSMPI